MSSRVVQIYNYGEGFAEQENVDPQPQTRKGKEKEPLRETAASSSRKKNGKVTKTIKIWNDQRRPAEEEVLQEMEIDMNKIQDCVKDCTALDLVFCTRKTRGKYATPAVCHICEELNKTLGDNERSKSRIGEQTSSSALRDHLINQHKECITREPTLKAAVDKLITMKGRVSLENESGSTSAKRKAVSGPMEKFVSKKSNSVAHIQNVVNFKKVLPLWCSLSGLPFRAFETPIAKYAISMLAGSSEVDGQSVTLSSKIVRDSVVGTAKLSEAAVKNALSKVFRLSISLDCWTDTNTRTAYIAFVANYYDRVKKRNSYVCFRFDHMQEKHSGKKMAIRLIRAATDFEIASKIITILGDGASNNESMAQFLALHSDFSADPKFATMLIPADLAEDEEDIEGLEPLNCTFIICLAHRVNTMLEKLLEKADEHLRPLHSIVNDIKNSHHMQRFFREEAKRQVSEYNEMRDEDEPPMRACKLMQRSDTRWEGELECLESIIKMQDAVQQTIRRYNQYCDSPQGDASKKKTCIPETSWQFAKALLY